MTRRFENVDVDLFDDKEDAVQFAIDSLQPGDHVIICRADLWAECAPGGPCEMCARIEVYEGLTASEAMAQARAHRA